NSSLNNHNPSISPPHHLLPKPHPSPALKHPQDISPKQAKTTDPRRQKRTLHNLRPTTRTQQQQQQSMGSTPIKNRPTPHRLLSNNVVISGSSRRRKRVSGIVVQAYKKKKLRFQKCGF
ncbi:hypothetical protein MMC31_007762, partial [Peltigera leucophlebia]|nr:hypothetical protein [Peltigera leucophlebia]